jgi:hypothetical protein
MKKAIKFLVLVVGVSVLLCAGAAGAEEATHMGNKACKMCHNKSSAGEQWNKWKAMNHAKSIATLQTDEAKAMAKEKGVAGTPDTAPECLRCHVTAYDVATKAAPAKIVVADGVQCESCHGPASLHIKDGKKRMMSKDESMDMSAHIQRPDAASCTECHNEESPTWDPKRYTLEDGSTSGFDFTAAWKKIDHSIPEK